MVRNRVYKTDAVVLKQMPLGETNRIITFYTREYGKIAAIARGVRRPGSKFGGSLEIPPSLYFQGLMILQSLELRLLRILKQKMVML